MMGADLGHLCALQHGDGHRECAANMAEAGYRRGAAQGDRLAE
jgi:hypothetical protein